MKNFLMMAALAVALVTLAGCGSSQSKTEAAAKSEAPAKSAAQLSYEAALGKAKSAQKAAGAMKNEWRDTGKLLKQADAAAKAGDYAKAEKLARKAELQGHAAVAQAKEQQGAGNPSYLY